MPSEHAEREPSLSPAGAAAKRPWHPPEMQEVDVVETEFGGGIYDPADVTTYSS